MDISIPKNKIRNILFIYPNINTELRIPLAISILISCVRSAGHRVKLFDTTFMAGDFFTDDELMARMGTHKETNLKELIGEIKHIDIESTLIETVTDFKPDLVAISLLERNFNTAQELCTIIKNNFPDLKIFVGGILPTIAPEFVLREHWVDYICLGEGEEAIIDVINSMDNMERLRKISNIWLKNDSGSYQKNPLRPLINLDIIPDQDWTDFDVRHLNRPFMGNVYVCGTFEFSRGCKRACTFCVAPKLRERQANLGHYHRTKSPLRLINEIYQKCLDYNLNMVAFGDTDFLSWVPKEIMTELLVQYKRKIDLPFTIQTAATSLGDAEILRLLHEAGCCAISVGVESGSEHIRKNVIKKIMDIDKIKNNFDLCRNAGLRITANYMVGLPFETVDDIWETIKLNRYLNPPSIAVTFFTPFLGTKLYNICLENNFYDISNICTNNYEKSPLKMTQLTADKIDEMLAIFINDFKKYQDDFNPILNGSKL